MEVKVEMGEIERRFPFWDVEKCLSGNPSRVQRADPVPEATLETYALQPLAGELLKILELSG